MSAAFLIVREGPDSGASARIEDEETVLVGRAAEADLRLSDELCSREHVELRLEGKTVVATDLDSSNGTMVNGEQIIDPIRLSDRDEIRVGNTMLELRVDARGKTASIEPVTATKIQRVERG